jgi:hypothetical protein
MFNFFEKKQRILCLSWYILPYGTFLVFRMEFVTSKLRTLINDFDQDPKKIRLWAFELVEESYGVELMECIGYVYETKADQLIGENKFLGIPGFFTKWGDRAHLAKEGVSLIMAATGAVSSANKLQSAQTNPEADVGSDLVKKLEEETMNKAMNAVWHVNKLEIESVVRKACDNIIRDNTKLLKERLQYAETLRKLGRLFIGVSLHKRGKFGPYKPIAGNSADQEQKTITNS